MRNPASMKALEKLGLIRLDAPGRRHRMTERGPRTAPDEDRHRRVLGPARPQCMLNRAGPLDLGDARLERCVSRFDARKAMALRLADIGELGR